MVHQVSLIGSGNWGSAIARIAGTNCANYPDEFEKKLSMWVHEEIIDGEKLTEIINSKHENVKYLPGYKLPENVVAEPDIGEAVFGASILIFCVPHQFLRGAIAKIKERGYRKDAIAVSLIKGIEFDDNGVVLVSKIISSELGIDCSVLMGANIASEVAAENFCEATLGCMDLRNGTVLRKLFDTPKFRVACALGT